jgi:hypothetical protein
VFVKTEGMLCEAEVACFKVGPSYALRYEKNKILVQKRAHWHYLQWVLDLDSGR